MLGFCFSFLFVYLFVFYFKFSFWFFDSFLLVYYGFSSFSPIILSNLSLSCWKPSFQPVPFLLPSPCVCKWDCLHDPRLEDINWMTTVYQCSHHWWKWYPFLQLLLAANTPLRRPGAPTIPSPVKPQSYQERSYILSALITFGLSYLNSLQGWKKFVWKVARRDIIWTVILQYKL